MNNKKDLKVEDLTWVETEDLYAVSSVLNRANRSNQRELVNLYYAVRNGKVKIKNSETRDAVCILLSDIIVEQIKYRKRSPIRVLIGSLCILTAFFLIYCMYTAYDDEAKSEEKIQGIQQMHQEAIKNTVDSIENVVEDVEEPATQNKEILAELKDLYNINSDLIAWITIDGTSIDYPVVQTIDNEYYLTHDFYKEESTMGNIFLDYRNGDLSDTNLLVYGHNMRNGEMFGELDNYKDYDYFQQHQTILFNTLYERYTYKIIAVCMTKVAYTDDEVFRYYNFTKASSNEELYMFWENIKMQSVHDVTYEFKENDNYLTLSTCSNFTENGRLYIVAVREDEK